MEKWEYALVKFLEEWKSKEYVLAGMLTGSYAVDNNTDKSDIDVHIILRDDIDWRERENQFVDGFFN